MKKMKTFNVEYYVAHTCLIYQKAIKALRLEDAAAYIRGQGYEIRKIYEAK